MRKIIIAGIIALVPVAAFADIELGPTAMLNFPLTGGGLAAELSGPGLTANDFTFGGDFRLNLDPFQLSAYFLYTPGYDEYDYVNSVLVTYPGWLEFYPDVGLTFKLWIIRLSLGVGPSLGKSVYEDPALQAASDKSYTNFGLHIKGMVDFYIGPIALSLVYMTNFKIGGAAFSDSVGGYFGLSALLALGD